VINNRERCHHPSQTRLAVAVARRQTPTLYKAGVEDKADKPNEEEEQAEDEVVEIIKTVDMEEKHLVTHQGNQSFEDLSKQWGDMCLSYLKNQMTGHNTTRQSTN
jgi:hypothetical protein